MFYKNIKRSLDFIFAFLLLVISIPAILIICFFIKIKMGSPIFFFQERPGMNEKMFKIYKFRTMTDEREKYGNLLPDHKRLTLVGKILRKTSLDELPQLLNIIRGEMSFIGPRPLLERYLPFYTEEEKIRHSIRPGITGLAQVNGRNYLEWDKRLEMDIEYVKKISFSMDIKILIKTIEVVLKRQGVAEGGEMKEKDLDEERRWIKE